MTKRQRNTTNTRGSRGIQSGVRAVAPCLQGRLQSHWWQFDFSGYLIWTLERLHLVREVYRIPASLRRSWHAEP